MRRHSKKPNFDGDFRALENLYIKYRMLLFRTARSILPHNSDAEDAVHTAFVRFMNDPARLSRFTDEENKKYLFIMVRGIALDMLEKKHRSSRLDAETESAFNTSENAEANLAYENIKQNIKNLPAKVKNVAVLFFVQHMTEQEIADALDMNINTVRSYVSRARKILRKWYDEEGSL